MDFAFNHAAGNVPVHCKTPVDYAYLSSVDPNYRVMPKPRKVQQKNASVAIKSPKWIKDIINYFRKHPVK